MPTLTIDGKSVEVPAGATVLQAAKKIGVKIPYFCYHKKLSIAANCRMCLVEVAKMPKLTPACYQQVTEGMEVFTQTPRVKDQQRATLEFILINHPVDCPICDQSGECKLQDYYYKHDYKASRLNVLPVHKPKVVRLGSQVVLDAERCILCTRCVRFFEEIEGSRWLGVFQRGDRSELGTYPGQPIESRYAGNVIDICPVGALTSDDFRFKCRSWLLTRTPSVCPGCSRGCNVTVDHNEGTVYRLKPRDNDEVNQCWMCDDGRYGYGFVNEGRIETPFVRARGEAGPEPAGGTGIAAAEWDVALDHAAERLRSVGPGRIGIALSPQIACEDAHAFVRLGREALGSARFYLTGKPDGDSDKLLLMGDRNPNRAGVRLIAGEDDLGDVDELKFDIKTGRLAGLILVGGDLADAEIPAMLARLEVVILVATNETPLAAAADVVLPASTFAEKDGTFVNFQGRAQRIRTGPAPRGDARAEWEIAALLAERLGTSLAFTSAREAFRDLAARHPRFAGLTHEKVGKLGVLLPQSVAAAPAAE